MDQERNIQLRLSKKEFVQLRRALEVQQDILNDSCTEPFFAIDVLVTKEAITEAKQEVDSRIDDLVVVSILMNRFEDMEQTILS